MALCWRAHLFLFIFISIYQFGRCGFHRQQQQQNAAVEFIENYIFISTQR